MFRPVIDRFTNYGKGNFSRCLHNCNLQWVEILVPLGTGTFFQHRPQFIVQWIEVWAGGGPVIRFDEIKNMLLQPFCIFFTLWASAESCWKHHSPSSMNMFLLEVVRHHLTWLGRPRYSFLHWRCKNESGLHQSMKLPTKTLVMGGGWRPLWTLRFCIWPHNNFWHIRGHFGDWISPCYWKWFH